MKTLLPILFLAMIPDCQYIEYKDHTRLVHLSLGLGNYRQVNGKMPSDIMDQNGKPLLSWRVAILKYGGGAEIDLYKQFKLDEAWNSPHNLKVAETIPFFYIDPKGPKCNPINGPNTTLWTMNPKTPNYTPYLGITGKTAAFRPDNPRDTDAKDQHAAIVVVDKSDVFWTEPRDIPLEKVKKGDILRTYGKKIMYLTAGGSQCDWEKGSKEDAMNYPPVYEYEEEK